MNCTLRYSLLCCLLLLLAVSCKEELDMDFHEVTPFYVVQGDVTNQETKVLITRSRSMNDSVKCKGLPGAEVRVSDDKGRSELLVYGQDGYYRSPSGWKGETGRTYRLNVKMDGNEYSATSFMMPPVSLDSIYFVWMETAGMRMLILKCFQSYAQGREADSIRQGQLYHTHTYVTRNGRFYRGQSGRQLNPNLFNTSVFVGCMPEKMKEEDDPDNRESILYEGDKMHIEVWSLDTRAYDYFFSIKTGKQNASNPLTNIVGGAQGYFSAHHVTAMDTVFSFNEIRVSN
ncbi:MAG: DUF4249 family protein [Bacteroidaceae bacterium]|nr:DUF4249 family protein [Bacteroidaceae bacterium]